MTLTWWEYEELIEHLAGREDIWAKSEGKDLWIRLVDDIPAMAVFFTAPKSNSRFRTYEVSSIGVPNGWDQPTRDAYLTELVMKWTFSYTFRQDVFNFLLKEVKLDLQTAVASAVYISYLQAGIETQPKVPSPADIWPDVVDILPAYVERNIVTQLLPGGGYVSLRMQGGQIRTRLSLRNVSGGYGHYLEGYVRPTNGAVWYAAAALGGWPLKRPIPPDKDYPIGLCEPEENPVLPYARRRDADGTDQTQDLGADSEAPEGAGTPGEVGSPGTGQEGSTDPDATAGQGSPGNGAEDRQGAKGPSTPDAAAADPRDDGDGSQSVL